MAKMAEKCREQPFVLSQNELKNINIYRQSLQPRNPRDAKGRPIPECCSYMHVGVFFDGTNNNKYFDTGSFSHSNVSRLYDVFPGGGVTTRSDTLTHSVKVFNPTERLEEDKMRTEQTVSADHDPLYHNEPPIEASDRRFFRKIYVPGVGTPFRAVGDKNETGLLPMAYSDDNRAGEALGAFGDERILWAMLQTVNLLMEQPLQAKEIKSLCDRFQKVKIEKSMIGGMQAYFSNYIRPKLNRRLPKITKLKLYVFGFSRGATAARSFCQRMQNWFPGNKIPAGGKNSGDFIEIEYVFLGIFDTVSSVGMAHAAAIRPGATGHNSWADLDLMYPKVNKCVHMVAAHEVRGCFPLTSAAAISNSEEIVYPGVHSDIGGGYSPYEQGKSTGGNGDNSKLSQIPLADMYRKALLAGVPFLLPNEWQGNKTVIRAMSVDAGLIKDFNNYIVSTKSRTNSLAGLLYHHHNLYVQWWRKREKNFMQVMSPKIKHPKNTTKDRDKVDLEDGYRGLRYELDFFARAEKDGRAPPVKVKNHPLMPVIRYLRTTAYGKPTEIKGETPSVFDWDWARNEKFKEWKDMKQSWNSTLPLQDSIIKLFDDYVHDSKAWFRVETVESWGYLRRRFIIFGKGK